MHTPVDCDRETVFKIPDFKIHSKVFFKSACDNDNNNGSRVRLYIIIQIVHADARDDRNGDDRF